MRFKLEKSKLPYFIICAFMALVTAWGVISAYCDNQKMSTYVQTRGRVFSLKHSSYTTGTIVKETKRSIYYQVGFQVDGREYLVKDSLSIDSEAEKDNAPCMGEFVRVYYNQNNPNEARIFKKKFDFGLLSFIGWAVYVLGLWMFFPWKNVTPTRPRVCAPCP